MKTLKEFQPLKSSIRFENEVEGQFNYVASIIGMEIIRSNPDKLTGNDRLTVFELIKCLLEEFCRMNKGYMPDTTTGLVGLMDAFKVSLTKKCGWKIDKECQERVA